MKYYSLTIEYALEVPDETDHEELKLDLVDVLLETIEAHKGTLGGTLRLIKTDDQGHTEG